MFHHNWAEINQRLAVCRITNATQIVFVLQLSKWVELQMDWIGEGLYSTVNGNRLIMIVNGSHIENHCNICVATLDFPNSLNKINQILLKISILLKKVLFNFLSFSESSVLCDCLRFISPVLLFWGLVTWLFLRYRVVGPMPNPPQLSMLGIV